METQRKFIGAHVSAAGGVSVAPMNAHDIGANAFALFTRNQRQWAPKPLVETEISAFKENLKTYGFEPEMVLPHASYLINLGNPDAEGLAKSRSAFLDEMQRCELLGIKLLNFHPGSHLGKISEKACLSRIAESIDLALEETSGVTAVIENTAGQGTNLGYTLEQIAEIMEQVKDHSRIGLCIDTAHTLSAGYEIRTEEGYQDFMKQVEELIGIKYLKAIHLNDTKKELASRVDRHESLGKGLMGVTLFEQIINDPRTDRMPIILETPDPERWADEIYSLRLLDKRGDSVSASA